MVVLALMAVGAPLWAGSGDTPGDPQSFSGRNIWFDFAEFSVNPPSAVEYRVWQAVGPADSTLVTTLAHVGDGRTYSVPVTIQGSAGTLNKLRVWGTHEATGLRASCTKWVTLQEFSAGGCACRAR